MNVDSRWKRGLSFIVSVSMVLGLVPTPALAEAMEEVSDAMGSTVQVADPQGQATGQATAQSKGQASGNQTSNGEGTKPVGGEPAKEGSQALSTGDVGLTVQGDGDGQPNHEYTQFSLGTSVDYPLGSGESLWGSFTAPETGLYDFTAHNASFAPASLTIYRPDESWVASQNAYSAEYMGGTEAPAVITRYMSQGEQLLLSVSPINEGEQVQGSVMVQTSNRDVHDLALASLQLNNSMFTLPESVEITATLTDCAGQTVDPANYDLVFYTHNEYGNQVPCDGVPSEAGQYYAAAKAKDGNAGGYSGHTSEVDLQINHPMDLGSPWWYINFQDGNNDAGNYFETPYTGNPIQIPQVKVWRWGDSGEIALNPETDFTVSIDGGATQIVNPGEYTLRAHGAGNYRGTTQNWLTVRVMGNDNDLSQGRLDLNMDSYQMTGDPVSINCFVYGWNGMGVGDESYSLVFYDAADATQPLDSAPTEAGTYWVAARGNGTEQEGYFGETPKVQFEIIGQNHIASWDCSLSPDTFGYDGEPITWPTPSFYRYDDGGRIDLQEGTDFELVGYGDVDGNPIDTNNPPSAIGPYWADYRGIGSYTGSTRLYFSIADPKDISTSYWNSDYADYGYTGQPVNLSKSQIYRHDENGQRVVLRAGVDYTIDAYYSSDNPDEPLQGAPIEIGDYRVRYEGISPYTGTRDVDFQIVDVSELSQGSIELEDNTFVVGDSISTKATVKNSVGDVLTEGTDYELVYYESDGVTALQTAPTVAGNYAVAARAKEGSVYTDETQPTYFGLRAPVEGIVDIENNGSYAASVTHESDSWIGKFTAPATASYEFFTQGNAKTLSNLYGDPWQNQYMNYAAGYGDNPNFRMVQYLEAGQTVYLFVSSNDYSTEDALQTTVCVRTANNKDLANGSIEMSGFDEHGYAAVYEYTGNPIEPTVRVIDSMHNELTKGTDYELVFYSYGLLDSGEYGLTELEGAPTAGGPYRVAAKAKEGNAAEYIGVTPVRQFSIDDPWDIGLDDNVYRQIPGKDFQYNDLSVPGVFHTGEPLTPQVSVYSYALGSNLVEGTDYTVTYANNTNVTKEGEFATATIQGIGKYHGTAVLKFVVADLHDLKAYVWAAGGKLTVGDTNRQFGQDKLFPVFRATGSPVEPIVAVNQFANTPAPIEESDFTVTYEESEYEYGEHYAVLTAKQDSSFTGVAKVRYGVQSILPLYTINATPRLNGVPAANVSVEKHGWDEWVYTLNGYEGDLWDLSWALDSDDGMLFKGTDYTVSVSEDETGFGEVKYCFQGINGYKMKCYAYVRRGNATNIADLNISFPLSADLTYTGSAVMPRVIVLKGTLGLTEGKDYTVTYQNNVNVGTATVTVTGKGDYYGTKTMDFEILPATIAATNVFGVAESAMFTGSLITMPVEVIVNGTTLQLQDLSDSTKGDYTIAYENNVNAGTATVTITGKSNYTGAVSKNFTINPVAIDSDAVVLTGVEDKEFTGSAIEQDGLTLTLGNYTLDKDTDYTVEYANNINKGQATMTIAAKPKDNGGSGNFTGSRTATFNVTGKVLSDENATVGAIEPVTYDCTAKTPEPTVTLKEGGRVLQKGTDYDLSYANNTNAGTATVTITGKGDFGGTLTREFTISPATITSVEDIEDQTYTGAPITPALTVKAGEITLGANDYSATFSNNTNAGTATVTVVGNANFTGVQTKSFVIAPAEIDSVNVRGYHTYTGGAIEPELEVRAGSLTLGPNDYAATFSNNTNAGLGSASVTVTAAQGGNFSGSRQATFTIQPREIRYATIDAFPEQVYTGDPLTPELTLFDNGRTLAKGTDYEVTYADNTNVTAAGQFASITITGKGNYTGTKPSGFSIAPRSIARATVTAGVQTYTGGALTPGVTVKLGDKTLDASDYDVDYASNVNAGTATVTVTGKGNYTDAAKGTFQISPASIAEATIAPIDNQSFTGKAIKPAVSVRLDGDDFDPANYTVSYANNVKAGEATVTVTGTGNYTNSVSSTFRIDRVPIDSNDVIVSGIVDKTANGSEQTQDSLTLKLGDYTLTSDDYTIEYANNVVAGEATITIKATEGGSFTGTRTEHFRITQLTMGEVAAATYTGEAITPKPAIKDGDAELAEGTDFEYEYADNTNAGVATVTAKGKGAYDGTTMSAQFTINPAAISEVTVADSATYDGGAKTPEPTVKAGETTLVKDTDYTVEYRNNVNAGAASVVVTGKGNYGGTRGATFSIAGAGIDDATIDPIAEQTYAGKDVKPAVVVKLADKTLVEGVDYTVAYANNKAAGTATVTVAGAGNYTGETTADFTIAQKNLAGAQISAISDQTYTGGDIEPAFTVVLDGKTLVKGTDYNATYDNNINASTEDNEAEVTVTGTGNYSGSVSRQFTIKALNLADATIDGLTSFDADGKAKFVYTGDYIKPTVTVSLGGRKLVENSDYRLTYQNNLSAGQATATISAIGTNPNYVGELTAPFTIAPATITEVAIKDNATDFEYTGAAITPELVVKAGDLVLGAGDYTVTYLNNVNAGGATATVTGKGNYTGKASVAFNIVAVNAEGLFIDAIPDQSYAGGDEIKPSLAVKFDGKVVDAQSYDVTYANNTGVGVATATITPKAGSNFAGSRTVMFNIVPATIDSVDGVGLEVEYTGDPVTFSNLTVKAGDRTLGADDYTVSYANNVNAGTARLTVAGKGNYAGGGTYEFQITPKSLASGYTVELPKNADGTDIIYTETAGLDAFEPVPVVKDDGGKVLDPANYDVAYRNNAAAGEASVVVTGKGNYQGSPADATFTIYKFAGSAASDGENAVIWHVEGDGAMTIEPKKKGEDATLDNASSLTWSQAVADYTTSVSVDNNVTGCTDTSGMFSGLTNLTSVDISEFDTSEVTNMSGMFQGCESLTARGITGTLNTGGVTDMSNMFAGCTSLESLDFAQPVQQQSLFQSVGRLLLGTQANEGFDTSNVTNMSRMFAGCTSLTGEGLKDKLNTANVTNMSNMFAGCTGLTDLDLNGIDTTKVTDMGGMFRGCTGLRTLNVASFDTGAVTNMAGMYDGCALGQFTIGEGYMKANITEALPVPGASTGMWWATNAQVWRSNDTIRSLGTQAAGTYSSTGLLSADSTSIASANIEAATTNPYIYNGSEHKPVVDGVTIGQGQDQIPLVAGIDYEVGYQANQNAGTAQVVVKGIGDYSSSVSKEFAIQPKSLEDNTIEVIAPADATYNGAEQKGKPTVRSTEGPEATLVEDVDYELTYQDNVNAGTATVTVTGKGNYKDAKSTTFKIGKAASSISLADQTLAYTGRALSYSGGVTKSGSGGKVTYAYYSDAACTKAVAAGNVKSAGTYYVRATLAADANHNGATSNVAKLTITAKTFPDVPADAWYANVVARAVGLGLLSGYEDGRFGPNDKITRGQVAVILWNMAKKPVAGTGAKTFRDVGEKAYYYNAVRWASSKGVVSGYQDGKSFGPDDNVTREQLAVMLANYSAKVAGKPASGSASDYASMADGAKVSSWAVPAVGWCFKKGILSGSNGNVNPQGNATRAEAAKMVVGLHDLL